MKKNIKVLIVDDEPLNVEILLDILRFHHRYDCRWATSGEEALQILSAYIPEIILLDVKMSGIDGYEVCRRIRAQSEHRFSKIIMISGMSLIDDRLKGYEAGADDYLTKPYNEGELVAKLEVYSKLNRIEEVDTLKTTALNILRHETRTPLNGIIMGSDLLSNMEDLSEKAKGYVELVRQSGLKIQELVEKISRYYSIKDGILLNPSLQAPYLVINNIISDLSGSLSAGRVIFSCDEKIELFADWTLLTEAFRYLLDNSIKECPETQQVTINCQQKAADLFIQVGDASLGSEVALSERRFDGLFSSDLLHHHQGTGLSLAIAKEIIEEHGGQITCRNRENGGVLYEITVKNQPPC